MSDAQPRSICLRCTRPHVVCVCGLAPALETRTRVLFLQHPRERRMPIGTARLAHLGLVGSALRVGLDFAGDAVVRAALAGSLPPYVLFPGPGSLPVEGLARGEARTLIVLDGTWSEAKKLLRLNPALAALPRVSFAPRSKSEYHIRKQPADFCVSTIEALAHVLAAIEPEGFAAARLLDPFHAMVDRQRRYAAEVHSARHRRSAPRVPRVPVGVRELRAAFARVVCVHGEANAWPLRHPDWQPAEVVHWLAHRPATGERYEALLAPRRPLAPRVLAQLELGADALAAGIPAERWRAEFARFLRPDDLVVHWGSFPREVAAHDGLALGPAVLDLRPAFAQWGHRKAGAVEAAAARLDLAAVSPLGQGRGGRRLAHLVAIIGSIAHEMTGMPR